MRVIGALLLLVAFVSNVHAQERARVLVSAAHGASGVFQFSPCIPAEGSACGAWLDHSVDTTAVPVAQSVVNRDGDSLAIDRGRVKIFRRGTLDRVFTDSRGAAVALAMHPWGRSAFVVLHGLPSAPNFVLMLDLDTRTSIASTSFRFEPAGVAVIR